MRAWSSGPLRDHPFFGHGTDGDMPPGGGVLAARVVPRPPARSPVDAAHPASTVASSATLVVEANASLNLMKFSQARSSKRDSRQDEWTIEERQDGGVRRELEIHAVSEVTPRRIHVGGMPLTGGPPVVTGGGVVHEPAGEVWRSAGLHGHGQLSHRVGRHVTDRPSVAATACVENAA